MARIIHGFLFFLRDVLKNRRLILDLTIHDFRSRYLGSYLGLLWAFIQPVVTILIFWFVFEVGFKSQPVGDYPFILWLIVGIIPWFFISESLVTGTQSIVDQSYLVKKVVFRVSVLPLVKIFCSVFVHSFFVLVILGVCFFYGISPNTYFLQVLYYFFCTVVLLIGVTWLSSSLTVFLKDISQIVAMIVQFGFWLTPIFWSLQMIPEKFHLLIKLNPLCYIISGYRDSFLYNVWFWERPLYSLYFWFVTIVLFCVGAIVFSRLRPHFADVL